MSSDLRSWTARRAPWLVLVGILPFSALFGWLGTPEDGTFNWDVAVSAGTAYGTLALALVTWRLVSSAREDARGTLELARLAEREQSDRLIPFVFPITDRRWLDEQAQERKSIAVRNGAPGLALNVSGQIFWPAGSAEMTSATLASGDHATVHLGSEVPSWKEVWGQLFYMDIAQRRWETRFTYEERPDGRIRAQVCGYGVDLPAEAYPAGWEMPGGAPQLRLPEH